MTANTPQIAARKPQARSRVHNGKSLFIDPAGGEPIDGRTLPARVFRDVLAEIVGDLGGREAISEGEYQLARRAAALSVECLKAESQQAAGEALDLETFIPSVNALNRTLNNLGLKRRARDVTPPDPLRYIQGEAAP